MNGVRRRQGRSGRTTRQPERGWDKPFLVQQEVAAIEPATSSFALSAYRWAVSSVFAVPKTAMHPVKQLGYTLFAPSGMNTWLLLALAATEWAVLAGCRTGPVVTAGTLKVGTSCLRV